MTPISLASRVTTTGAARCENIAWLSNFELDRSTQAIGTTWFFRGENCFPRPSHPVAESGHHVTSLVSAAVAAVGALLYINDDGQHNEQKIHV